MSPKMISWAKLCLYFVVVTQWNINVSNAFETERFPEKRKRSLGFGDGGFAEGRALFARFDAPWIDNSLLTGLPTFLDRIFKKTLFVTKGGHSGDESKGEHGIIALGSSRRSHSPVEKLPIQVKDFGFLSHPSRANVSRLVGTKGRLSGLARLGLSPLFGGLQRHVVPHSAENDDKGVKKITHDLNLDMTLKTFGFHNAFGNNVKGDGRGVHASDSDEVGGTSRDSVELEADGASHGNQFEIKVGRNRNKADANVNDEDNGSEAGQIKSDFDSGKLRSENEQGRGRMALLENPHSGKLRSENEQGRGRMTLLEKPHSEHDLMAIGPTAEASDSKDVQKNSKHTGWQFEVNDENEEDTTTEPPVHESLSYEHDKERHGMFDGLKVDTLAKAHRPIDIDFFQPLTGPAPEDVHKGHRHWRAKVGRPHDRSLLPGLSAGFKWLAKPVVSAREQKSEEQTGAHTAGQMDSEKIEKVDSEKKSITQDGPFGSESASGPKSESKALYFEVLSENQEDSVKKVDVKRKGPVYGIHTANQESPATQDVTKKLPTKDFKESRDDWVEKASVERKSSVQTQSPASLSSKTSSSGNSKDNTDVQHDTGGIGKEGDNIEDTTSQPHGIEETAAKDNVTEGTLKRGKYSEKGEEPKESETKEGTENRPSVVLQSRRRRAAAKTTAKPKHAEKKKSTKKPPVLAHNGKAGGKTSPKKKPGSGSEKTHHDHDMIPGDLPKDLKIKAIIVVGEGDPLVGKDKDSKTKNSKVIGPKGKEHTHEKVNNKEKSASHEAMKENGDEKKHNEHQQANVSKEVKDNNVVHGNDEGKKDTKKVDSATRRVIHYRSKFSHPKARSHGPSKELLKIFLSMGVVMLVAGTCVFAVLRSSSDDHSLERVNSRTVLYEPKPRY